MTDSVKDVRMDWVKVIAVIQVLGGVHGLVRLIADPSVPQEMEDAGLISYSIFVFLLVMSIISGILLWLKKRRGFVWSIFIQVFQAVRFTFGPINYGFHLLLSLGLYIRFLKDSSGIGVDVELLETYFYIYTKVVYKFNLYLPFDVVVNVSSLLCFFYLYFIFDRLYPMEVPHHVSEAA